MAKKDVMHYYDVISNQYLEMQESLKDMEEELRKNLISPDRVEQLKQTIEPIKNNYMRISYIVFLLNKPNKFRLFINNILDKLNLSANKRAFKKVKKEEFKKLEEEHGLEAVEKENKDIIDNLKL